MWPTFHFERSSFFDICNLIILLDLVNDDGKQHSCKLAVINHVAMVMSLHGYCVYHQYLRVTDLCVCVHKQAPARGYAPPRKFRCSEIATFGPKWHCSYPSYLYVLACMVARCPAEGAQEMGGT